MYELVALTLLLVLLSIPYSNCMSTEEIKELREESKDMFYHAYNAYLFNAFPADELMPLTCQGKSKYPLILFLSYWRKIPSMHAQSKKRKNWYWQAGNCHGITRKNKLIRLY